MILGYSNHENFNFILRLVTFEIIIFSNDLKL